MRPMLAVDCDPDNIKFPVMASPKLDGVRALIVDGVVMSRNMKPIPNQHVQSLFGKKKFNGLDGELIVGDAFGEDVFRRTQSGVMTMIAKPDVTYHIFDCLSYPELPFRDRFFRLFGYNWLHPKMSVVQHFFVEDNEELLGLESNWLGLGYEGAMLRDPEGPYKFGRSTLKEAWLLKLKRFSDSEAKIIGFVELMRNENGQEIDALGLAKRSTKKAGMVPGGTLGALTVEDLKTGVKFNIGTGIDAEMRAWMWRMRKVIKGQIVSYKYFGLGINGAPRFPVLKGFRDKVDL